MSWLMKNLGSINPFQGQTLGALWDQGGARGNNLDFVRFVAASLVIFSHSWEITQGSPVNEPIYQWSGGETKLGVLSVLVFFAISGFLITASWAHKPELKSFLWRRFLRLFPGLVVAIGLTLFLVGPLLTSLPWEDYWRDPQTALYTINITTFNKWDSLPGLFSENPLPHVINGSLWTLKFEVMCYGAVALFGVMGLLRGWVALTALLFSILTIFLLGAGPHEGISFYLYKFALLAQAFFAGAVLYLWRHKVPLSGGLAWVMAGLIVVGFLIGQVNLMVALGGAYLTFWFALARLGPIIRHWGASGDASYGIYIYGFVAQQMVQALFQPQDPWLNFMLAWPVALLLAFASWDLVESRALKAKKWIDHRPRVAGISAG